MPYKLIPRIYENRQAVIIATGPSLSPQQLNAVAESDAVKFGVNNTWNAINLDVHVTVNPTWWDHYWEREGHLRDAVYDKSMQAWAIGMSAMDRYPVNQFGWFDDEQQGLSDNPGRVNIGHSSGFAALNIAYLMGCSPILLIGHDMSFGAGYDGRKKRLGGPRHYFGEYPKELEHWPSVRVGKDGSLIGLIAVYEVAARQEKVDIINCTPGSALACFPTGDLHETLGK